MLKKIAIQIGGFMSCYKECAGDDLNVKMR